MKVLNTWLFASVAPINFDISDDWSNYLL
jgi:hypothetical protein